jgi:hypothetical protein
MKHVAPKIPVFEKYSQDNGFELKLGRWQSVYSEGQKKLTIPVEMLTQGDYLWEFAKANIRAWDSPFESQHIEPAEVSRIVERIQRFIELTGKSVRVY